MRSLVLYGLWVLLGSVSATGSCRAASLCCTGRDSSCVVQRTVAGVIGHGIPSLATFADKPCYCDHACLKLGDCCEDFKQACGGEWLPCPLFQSKLIKLGNQVINPLSSSLKCSVYTNQVVDLFEWCNGPRHGRIKPARSP